MTLLVARDIAVSDGALRLVEPVTVTLEPGEPLIVPGETGPWKSLLAQAIMGTLPDSLRARGLFEIGGRSLRAEDRAAFRGLWGRRIAVLPQEPWLSLDPLMRAGAQVADAHRFVAGLSAATARAPTADLEALGLGGADTLHPHWLSGGMAQRVAIAAARAGGAEIVFPDEPTKDLDAARRDEVAAITQREVILMLAWLARTDGLAIGLVSHDTALVDRIADEVLSLPAGTVAGAPEDAGTRSA